MGLRATWGDTRSTLVMRGPRFEAGRRLLSASRLDNRTHALGDWAVGRRHGITLHSEPACQPDATAVSQAANILLYGPDVTASGRARSPTQKAQSPACSARTPAPRGRR